MSCRIAAIDFGTNTARLLIADVATGTNFSAVLLEREIVRMGGGFCNEQGLSQEAMQRGVNCLSRFSAIISDHGVSGVRAVATSAIRDAANGWLFVERVKEETGISLKTIDGTSEGVITLAGVMAGLDKQYEEMIVFDVGGGSTEYTLASHGSARFTSSLPLGVVRLTESKVTPGAMQKKIKKELDLLYCAMEFKGLTVKTGTPLVATAGTATTLAAIHLEMCDYDYRKVNNTVLSQSEIYQIYERLLPLSNDERLEIPGLEKGREDLIIAGILITLNTMELFGIDQLKVSDYGLLEGLILSDAAISTDLAFG
ncbi:MAG TPA: exopolyphosphatase [Negativicutes bacterium]|jgi:exopolyphosphatase/guanosine-5'-triphosphate,3'-diphosphate pyrophosphatase